MLPQPTTSPAPSTASWDTSGLIQALHAASLHQPADWLMDTGASQHMTGDNGNLSSYHSFSLPYSHHVVVGNGSLVPVLGSSTATLPTAHTSFKWHNVLHTSNLIKNLISMRKFACDNNCSVEFDIFGFSVKDLVSRREIMRSNSVGDLYPFGGSGSITSLAALSACLATSKLWHR